MRRTRDINARIVRVMALLAAGLCSSAPVITTANPEDTTMDQTESQWLSKLEPLGSRPMATKLVPVVEAMKESARAPVRAAYKVWQAPQTRELGRELLVDLETAILLDTPITGNVGATDRHWLLARRVEMALELHDTLIQELETALTDKTWIKEPAAPVRMERKPPRRRVCDEALVLLRQLREPDKDQVAFMVDRDAFFHLPVSERDQQIRQALIDFRK
jgi:hypothetical protein